MHIFLKEMLSLDRIKNDLISVVKLSKTQAEVLLLIVNEGKMSPKEISEKLGISQKDAFSDCKKLVELGGFIEITSEEFESMHPRFSAVNMYRKMCEREKIEFKMNLTVDNIGVVLEKPYENARTGKK